ncbi:MAG: glutamate-1-semialdehyde 2,1-aminomutase [Rhodothermaceae bacterium]|nr:glutamate-1-semialdehyde 2,1-aminomutase [Rhodothermaceae bacterium]
MTTLAAPARSVAPSATKTARYARSFAHQQRAHRVIPGGAHTYAKGDDQMPEAAPLVIARGQGCRVWDLDGHAYIEYGMGLRAVTLGHAEPRVTAVAVQAMQGGTNFTRPAAIELEAAERFLGLIEGADMVKFCKDGSNATTAAVKLARAATGRAKVAVCAHHPFLSQDDWFIGTTPTDAGIPDAIKDLTVRFPYGDAVALEVLFALHPGEIAAVVLEPVRGAEDAGPYLRDVQRRCREHGAVLVFDEMITGFRWDLRGAQHLYGVTPDLSTFGKALANGFSVSALAGRRDLMERGGLRTEQERVFLLSATHGAETHALAAAVETMRIYETEDVVETLHRQGARLREGVEQQIDALGLHEQFVVVGRDCNLVFATRDAEGQASQAFRTLFLQELLLHGILAPSFVVSAAHDNEAIDQTVEAVGKALVVYRRALESGIERFLHGRPVKPVFRKHC